MAAEMSIDAFDTLTVDAAASTVSVWAAVPAWVDAVVAGRPYGTRDARIARAETGSTRRAASHPTHSWRWM